MALITLIDATFDLLAAAEDGPRLSAMLDADIAEGWLTFPEALAPTLAAYEKTRGAKPWGTVFFVLCEPRTLVGWGGFVGPPDAEGAVEIGYSIAPAFRGRGLASDAARMLTDRAFADSGVRGVTAHTLAEENASTSVLKKISFKKIAELVHPEDGALWRWKLERR